MAMMILGSYCQIAISESTAVGSSVYYGFNREDIGKIGAVAVSPQLNVKESENAVDYTAHLNNGQYIDKPSARYTLTPAEGHVIGSVIAYDTLNGNAKKWTKTAYSSLVLTWDDVAAGFNVRIISANLAYEARPLLVFVFPLAPLYDLTLEFNDKIKEIWVETFDTRGTFVKYTAANPVVKVRGNSTYRAYAVANAPWASLDTAANPFVGTVGSSNPPAYQPTLVGADVILTFDPQGGDVSRYFKRVRIGAEYGELPTPTYDQYAFLGWYDSPTGGNLITASSIVTIEEEHTLFARWSIPAEMVRISFDATGGASSISSMQVSPGAALGTLPTPTRSGYRFLGWFTRIFGGVEITASTIAEDDMTIYAHWERTTEDPPPPPPTIPEGQGSADWFYFN